MKWYGHLLFYLISCVVAELLLVMFFALDAIGYLKGLEEALKVIKKE